MFSPLTSLQLPDNLFVQVSVLAAVFWLYKQWVTNDFTELKARMTTVEANKADRKDVTAMDEKFTNALERLANTVDAFVRISTEERFRTLQQSTQTDKDLEVKVTRIEERVDGMGSTLDRILEQLMARRSGD